MPLGGERHDVQALRLWFQRLERLVPTLHLAIRDTWSTGAPWNTTLIIRWDSTGHFPDGRRCERSSSSSDHELRNHSSTAP